MRYSSPRISTSKPASGANSTRSPSSRLRTVGPDGDDLGPREPTVEVGGGGDEDAAAALAVAGVVGRQHQEPVGGHADRLLRVVACASVAREAMTRRLPSALIGPMPRATGFVASPRLRLDSPEWPSPPRFAGRHAPLVTQARAEVCRTASRTRRVGATALAYFHLTKPRVIELLLVTTLPAMILAAGEMPSLAPDRSRCCSAARSPPVAPTPSTAGSSATATR